MSRDELARTPVAGEFQMKTIRFPKKKRRSPEDFQHGYDRRWWASIARTAVLAIVVAAVVFVVLTIWGPAWQAYSPEIWRRVVCAFAAGLGVFVAFAEPRPPRDAGERAYRILHWK